VKLVPKTVNGKELMQVRIGGFASKSDCTPEIAKLKSAFNVPTVIVTE
jgi:hypothetical protein